MAVTKAWLVSLQVVYVYAKSEQITEFVVDNESQFIAVRERITNEKRRKSRTNLRCWGSIWGVGTGAPGLTMGFCPGKPVQS